MAIFLSLKTKPEWNRVDLLSHRNVSTHLVSRENKTELLRTTYFFQIFYQFGTFMFAPSCVMFSRDNEQIRQYGSRSGSSRHKLAKKYRYPVLHWFWCPNLSKMLFVPTLRCFKTNFFLYICTPLWGKNNWSLKKGWGKNKCKIFTSSMMTNPWSGYGSYSHREQYCIFHNPWKNCRVHYHIFLYIFLWSMILWYVNTGNSREKW